jgi:hypothetical protein
MRGRPEAANTFIKRGQRTVSLTSDDLFDRIINLKFTRWDNSSFVVRSDYEPVFQKDGSVRFIRCKQKPSIRVSYNQVAQDVAIEVDIEVTNLFIDKSRGDPYSAAGAGDVFAEGKGNPIETITVQMGYLAQFPDWTERQSKQDIDAYYELYNDYIPHGGEAKSGMRMVVTVLDTYTKGNPPDQVTYFHGIIGNIETGLAWTHDAEELDKNYGNPGEGEAPWLWNEFYQWITRRFIRASVLHKTTTEWETYTVTEDDKEVKLRRIKKGGQKVKIYGYNDYEVTEGRTEAGLKIARVVNFGALDGAPANFEPDTEWHELTLAADGLLADWDAAMFGVQCMLSAKLQEIAEPKTGKYGLPAAAGATLPHTSILSDSPQNSLGSQIAAMCVCYPYLRYYAMPDGNYYFYHADETKEAMFKNIEMNGMSGEDGYGIHPKAMLLPAVYDIAYGGTRTIRCPFFYLIAPMTIVFFMSKYYIGSMVGFY